MELNPGFVALSFLISGFAGYVSSELAHKLKFSTSGQEVACWASLGSLTLGIGLWATHFMGMLATKFTFSVAYSVIETLGSILPALIAAALVQLFVLNRFPKKWAALGLTVGILSMHFQGMSALSLYPAPSYSVYFLVISVLAAFMGSWVFLTVLYYGALQSTLNRALVRVRAGAILAILVCTVHYSAVYAMNILPETVCLTDAEVFPEHGLEYIVTASSFLIVLVAGGVSVLDSARIKHRIELLSLAERKAVTLANEITQSLRESEERYSLVVKLSTDALWDWDLTTGVLTVSSSRYKKSNQQYASGEQAFAEWAYFVHPEDRASTLEFLRKQGVEEWLEIRFVDTPDKSARWVRLSKGYVFREGRPVRQVGSLKDIDAYKKAELALQSALKAEKEVSALRARLVATASHEFRTPLTLIQSNAGLLRRMLAKGSDPEKSLKYCTRIENAVAQLVHVTETVLMLGPRTNSSQKGSVASVNLDNLTLEIVDDICSQGGYASRKVLVCLDGQGFNVAVDPFLLRQILSNIIENALKYSADSSAVKVYLIARMDEIKWVVVDKGIGIPAHSLSSLFQPFHRAPNVRELPGTGLGLALVKELVYSLGGVVSLDSEEGSGTTVIVRIPKRGA